MNKYTITKDVRMTIVVEDDRKKQEVWEELWDRVLKASWNGFANQMRFMCEDALGVHTDIWLKEIDHETQT